MTIPIPTNPPTAGNPAIIDLANRADHHIVMHDAKGAAVPLAVKWAGGRYVLMVDTSSAAPTPAPATEATQLAVKTAIDAVKAAADGTTAAVSAANTAIVAAIVASGAGKATTADITALAATVTATTLDQKTAIVNALSPLAGVQTNTAATVSALAGVDSRLVALLTATNTNDAAMLAAITATRDNVANAHSDAAAQLAEEQNQTALMNLNNLKLEEIRALEQSLRDHTKALRDTTGAIADDAAIDPVDDATQIALLKGLLKAALAQNVSLATLTKPAPKPKALEETFLRAPSLKATECRAYRITVYQQSTITVGTNSYTVEPDTVIERPYIEGVVWTSPQVDGDSFGHFSA